MTYAKNDSKWMESMKKLKWSMNLKEVMKKVGLLSMVVLLAVGCTGQGFIAVDKVYPDQNKEDVSFEEMQSLSYNYSEITKNLEDFQKFIDETGYDDALFDQDTFDKYYDTMVADTERMQTCYNLKTIEADKDVTQDKVYEEKEELTTQLTDTFDQVAIILKSALDTNYQDSLSEILTEEDMEDLAEYEAMTPREKEIVLETQNLEKEYDKLIQQGFTVEFNGKEWDIDMVLADSGEELSNSEVEELYNQIYEKENEAVGELYLKLIALNDETAKIEGYDNYMEYCMDGYNRDYTVEELDSLCGEIKDYVVDYYNSIYYNLIYTDVDSVYSNNGADQQTIVETVEPYLSEISPELTTTFDYMVSHNLLDIETSDTKAETGYTVGLGYFQDAYIFDNPYGSMMDYGTLVHEFGHYANISHDATPAILSSANMDVKEIHSQGLEMLYLDYSDEMFGEELGAEYNRVAIYRMLESIITGAKISEFESTIYQNPDMTLDEINQLYKDISEDYGTEYYGKDVDYTWVDISHLIMAPCYYVSYMTSAFSALDILSMSLYSRDEACTRYMELSALSSSYSYCQVVEEAGLRDIFSDGVAEQIAWEAYDYYWYLASADYPDNFDYNKTYSNDEENDYDEYYDLPENGNSSSSELERMLQDICNYLDLGNIQDSDTQIVLCIIGTIWLSSITMCVLKALAGIITGIIYLVKKAK